MRGNHLKPPVTVRTPGLSPRVRGNHSVGINHAVQNGSIPACAGEPRCSSSEHDFKRVYPRVCGEPRPTRRPHPCLGVYPRVCGGTAGVAWSGHPCSGLSPRVRGNPTGGNDRLQAYGSIPACAGEPLSRERRRAGRGVYPRVCGGTCRLRVRRDAVQGLSPRVRGNHLLFDPLHVDTGSIPACAGEPE